MSTLRDLGSALPVGQVTFAPPVDNRQRIGELLESLQDQVRVVKIREPLEVRNLKRPPCEECGGHHFHREDCSVTADTVVPERPTAGDRIRAFRKLNCWTQEQFGARVGASRNTVLAWERGTQAPSPASAARLAKLGLVLEAGEVARAGGPRSGSARTRSSRLAEVRRQLRSALVTEVRLAAVEVALGIGGHR